MNIKNSINNFKSYNWFNLRVKGTTFFHSNLPKKFYNASFYNYERGNSIISNYIINCSHSSYNRAIYSDPNYSKKTWKGPQPKELDRSAEDTKHIRNYLWGYSVRRGAVGKISGLVYRILDRLNGACWGQGDRMDALDHVKSTILERKYVEANYEKKFSNFREFYSKLDAQYIKKINAKAERKLNKMVQEYNTLAKSKEASKADFKGYLTNVY